jgi:hypothetical protein
MISTLIRRIQASCPDELSLLRRQMYSLTRQEMREGGVEGAATALARKPSCVSHGVSVDVVCFAQRAALEEVPLMISVAMHLHPERRSGEVYWEEADAWAQAVAGHEWFSVEPRGGLETLDGWVFHYALTAKAPGAQIIPVAAAGS